MSDAVPTPAAEASLAATAPARAVAASPRPAGLAGEPSNKPSPEARPEGVRVSTPCPALTARSVSSAAAASARDLAAAAATSAAAAASAALPPPADGGVGPRPARSPPEWSGVCRRAAAGTPSRRRLDAAMGDTDLPELGRESVGTPLRCCCCCCSCSCSCSFCCRSRSRMRRRAGSIARAALSPPGEPPARAEGACAEAGAEAGSSLRVEPRERCSDAASARPARPLAGRERLPLESGLDREERGPSLRVWLCREGTGRAASVRRDGSGEGGGLDPVAEKLLRADRPPSFAACSGRRAEALPASPSWWWAGARCPCNAAAAPLPCGNVLAGSVPLEARPR